MIQTRKMNIIRLYTQQDDARYLGQVVLLHVLVVGRNVGHFGHGRFGHGHFGQDISARTFRPRKMPMVDVSAITIKSVSVYVLIGR